MGLPKRLTEKQIKFANLIISEEGRKTNTECAIEAGYEENSAYVSASKLQNPLLYPLVAQYIGRLRAEKIKKYTDDVVQINTGGSCHLNATMLFQALEKMDLDKLDIIIIENVGNLICPVGFDLGEDYKIVMSSVNEGDDKPVKYPPVFIKSDLILLNKMDLLEISDFKLDFFQDKVAELNPTGSIIRFSCKTGKGLRKWIDWILEIEKK